MNKLKFYILCIILLLSLTPFIVADAYTDNEFYIKATELLEKAKAEFEKGEYDRGYAYSEEAKTYFKKAEEYKMIQILLARLNTKKEIAGIYIIKGEGLNLNAITGTVKEYFDKAVLLFSEGETAHEEGNTHEDFSNKSASYQLAIDKFVESAENAKMALVEYSDSYNYIKNKLDEVKHERLTLIRNKIMKENDDNDKIILDLIDAAKTAFDENNFEESNKLLDDALELMKKLSYEIMKEKAEKALKEAENALNNARDKGAEEKYNEKFDEAVYSLTMAKELFENEKFSKSIDFSRKVLEIVNGFVFKEPYKFHQFPKYYVVRLITNQRDCLWRIAEYPFIYNDPYKWKILYEKNKHILKYPANPDLIYPTYLIEIPSINGEKRVGIYDPAEKYPEFNPSLDYND